MLKFQEAYTQQSVEYFVLVIFVLVDDLYSFVKKNYRHLFLRMCERSQFNRTRRNLSAVKTFKDCGATYAKNRVCEYCARSVRGAGHKSCGRRQSRQ